MKKETTNKATEAQLLELLKKVLPKATHDAQLAGKIYQAVEHELKAKAKVTAFEKFCTRVELPDTGAKSVEAVKTQMAASFGDADITLKPNRKEDTLAVEIAMADGTQLSGEVKVNPNLAAEASEEQEITLKFVPFPVCLPGDKELIWLLAKRENLSPGGGGYCAVQARGGLLGLPKSGQKMLRDRVERSFPEFISRVAGWLARAKSA